jgi:hypothetical protein
MNMKFKLLSKREGFIAEKIVDAAITVHKVLGSGKRLGFLINFDVPLIKNGINRIILSGYALYSTGRKMQLSDFTTLCPHISIRFLNNCTTRCSLYSSNL